VSHVVLVRHGRAAAGWNEDLDPGLDELGRQQAEVAADVLELFGPLPILSSPLRRCQETALPLALRWGVDVTIEPDVGEVQSPTDDLAERGAWLRGFMQGRWADQGAAQLEWRDRVAAALLATEGQDMVVFTHFVAINAAVSVATGDPRVVSFAPDNGSRTELKVEGGRLEVVELGGQARTVVG